VSETHEGSTIVSGVELSIRSSQPVGERSSPRVDVRVVLTLTDEHFDVAVVIALVRIESKVSFRNLQTLECFVD